MTPRRGAGGGPEDRGAPGTHIPVLLSEMLAALAPKDGAAYIDGTFGAGGYARAILEAADCRVIALDRDPDAVRAGVGLVAAFAPRLTLVEQSFGNLADAAASLGLESVDGIALDIGVSSMQLDDPQRGFSFQSDGPLDMRMSRSGVSAAEVVNTYDEARLADVIHELGEERRARAIARAIVARRGEAPIARTRELADVVARVFHGRKTDGKHPATRTFQALRIHVNDELGELERGLSAAERLLKPGGRLVVVTFHSLEDRIVKRFLVERAGKEARASRHLPQSIKISPPSFRILNPRPLTPSKGELDVNPRARSARLRAAERTAALPRPESAG
jgi:16S rRNA (cytosine1402-N4)-methyltransferase